MFIDRVSENSVVVDVFLNKVRLFQISMVFVHRYFRGLHDVEVLSDDGSADNLISRVITKGSVVKVKMLVLYSVLHSKGP